jgi:glycosyltransferase involved in cell wall biosynthesis
MRVLWFTNIPSLYRHDEVGYNGGGWISSLERLIVNQPDIELGVSFLHSDKIFKQKQHTTTYYPISIYGSKFQKVKKNLLNNKLEKEETDYYLRVIDDFKPDIIHVFGTEQSFGLLSLRTKIPLVIHIQGILNPYLNAFFPPGTTGLDYLIHLGFIEAIKKFRILNFFKRNTKRELRILSNGRYFMGRTNWDRSISSLYSPNSDYFYCSEILRDAFYSAKPWEYSKKLKIVLISTISKVDYKGYDLILKTAKLLKNISNAIFEWRVFGIQDFTFWESKLKIIASDVNVLPMGIGSSEDLIAAIVSSDIYIHPSYIDNSPNSVCEAQLLGIPIISTNVGGVSSLILDNETGMLVPANDPNFLAFTLLDLYKDSTKMEQLGRSGRTAALKRHAVNDIVMRNIAIYQEILGNKSC